ncbi:MAG: hypothetical protein WC340_01225 [Kiritimatiellia bacterium]
MTEMIGLFLFATLIAGGGGILFKFYILDKLRVRQLFEGLEHCGYRKITQEDVLRKANKYKLSQNQSNSSDEIIKIIGKQNKNGGSGYLCDVHRKTRGYAGANRSTTHKYYTMLFENINLEINREIKIRKKLPKIAEHFLTMQASMQSDTGMEITEGLIKDFTDQFSITAKDHNKGITISPEVQKTLLKFINQFPLNQKKGPITTVFHISSDGWSVVCNRVVNKPNLTQLLQLSDFLTSSLSNA